MRIFVFGAILLAAVFLFGEDGRSLDMKSLDISSMQERYGPFAAARFRYLEELVESLKDSDDMTKLEKVNDFWNGVRYGTDPSVWGKRDYWATPYETLIKDRGDCEDYVIAKYFTLKRVGFDAKKLYFVYARVKGKNISHMVLAYYNDDRSDPLILDNINLKIFSSKDRKDLVPVYTFNGELLQRFADKSAGGLVKKELIVKRKWNDLIERMKRFEP